MKLSREFFWLLLVGLVSVGMAFAWYIDRSKLELRLERSRNNEGAATREALRLVKENNDLQQELEVLRTKTNIP